MPMAAMAAGAVLGGIGGAIKKGPKLKQGALGAIGESSSLAALQAYQNLVGKGPNGSDVTAYVDSARGYANQLNNVSSSVNGMYNFAAGNRLAQQQFGAQRTAMEQTFQDQMVQANRSAASSGRGTNDPILRARLAQEQSRQSAMLNAQQSSASVDFARQSTQDMLSLQGQRVNQLGDLSNQAFSNQGNLFSMGQTALQGDFSRQMQTAQYEQSRGGGIGGAITGMAAGLGAGAQAAQGMKGASNQTAFSPQGMSGGGASPQGGMFSAPVQNFGPAQFSGPSSSAPQFGVSAPHMFGPTGVYAPPAPSALSRGYDNYQQRGAMNGF